MAADKDNINSLETMDEYQFDFDNNYQFDFDNKETSLHLTQKHWAIGLRGAHVHDILDIATQKAFDYRDIKENMKTEEMKTQK
jgi:hypothetical protein